MPNTTTDHAITYTNKLHVSVITPKKISYGNPRKHWCQISQNDILHMIFRILHVFSQFLWNLTFIFSGFHETLSVMLWQITNTQSTLIRTFFNPQIFLCWFKNFHVHNYLHSNQICPSTRIRIHSSTQYSSRNIGNRRIRRKEG